MFRKPVHARGFTLVELLIVVAIVGLLAAIAIPNLLLAMHRSRQKRTMADMRSIAVAWEARAVDMTSYSAAGATFSMTAEGRTAVTYGALNGILRPTYIQEVPRIDGWSRPFDFMSSRSTYALRSAGRDGMLSDGSYVVGPSDRYDDDIVFSGGAFIRFPEGLQKD